MRMQQPLAVSVRWQLPSRLSDRSGATSSEPGMSLMRRLLLFTHPWLSVRFRWQRASGRQFLVPTELPALPTAIAWAYRPATRQSLKS